MATGVDLTPYRMLSFDCYGTFMYWATGIAAVLAPWAREQGHSGEDLLVAYADNEAAVERQNPAALYTDVLPAAFGRRPPATPSPRTTSPERPAQP